MSDKKVHIEFLYFEGCPSWKQGLANLRSALEKLHIDAELQMTLVASPEQAQEVGFYGSPSIKINGRDLEGRQGDFSFNCRIYRDGAYAGGVPTVTFLLRSLQHFLSLDDD